MYKGTLSRVSQTYLALLLAVGLDFMTFGLWFTGLNIWENNTHTPGFAGLMIAIGFSLFEDGLVWIYMIHMYEFPNRKE